MNKGLAIGTTLLIIGIAAVATVLFLFPYPPTQPPKADDAGWTEQGIKKVVDANNRFAFELYSELAKHEKGNIFYSPYSISAAFAMTYEGARSQTADEIAAVFHFPETNVLRPNFARIYNNINEARGTYTLRTGNALWVQKDYQLLSEYTNTVERYYGGKAANVDFVRETEKSRQTINAFIEKQTAGKIKDLIPPGHLSSSTRIILTNAIYFKGTWLWQFDKASTRKADFKITPTNIVKVQMMFMKPKKAKFNYADLGYLQILELPYKGEKVSMLILLPAESLDTIEANITAERLDEWKAQMTETKLDKIAIPKFEFSTKYFMKETLSRRMPTAFSLSADFSGMTGKRDLFITSVIHQAYVKVNEEGTEAAAATAVVAVTAPSFRKEFVADHPFIFIIQERETGNILFVGRVIDPTR